MTGTSHSFSHICRIVASCCSKVELFHLGDLFSWEGIPEDTMMVPVNRRRRLPCSYLRSLCHWTNTKAKEGLLYWTEGLILSSVTQSCLTLCDPKDCSMPGFPVHHQLLELAQTHVHLVGDAIQPSPPLLSPSPPAFNPSQHQGLFQGVIGLLLHSESTEDYTQGLSGAPLNTSTSNCKYNWKT